jgi:arylsulfatase A-like enzyme
VVAAQLATLADVEVPGHGGFAAANVTPPQQEKLALLYRADVHYADQQLGQLLASLERHGLADRAAVVVTSDHGEVLGEALAEFHYGFDHGEFLLPMEVRVPLWVRLPDGRRGVTEARTVETRAIFGTLAAAAAVPQADASSLPGLEAAGAETGADATAFIVRRSFQAENLPAVLRGTRLGLARDGQLLVRVAQDDQVRAETWQCGSEYPTALVRAPMSAEQIQRGVSALQGWLDAGTAPAQPVDAATRERLRALGYLD